MTSTTDHVWTLMSDDLAGFIRRRVADEHAAADILQDVFARIHDGLDGLRERDRLAAWVYRIARNAIAEHFRRRGAEDPLATDPPAPDEGAPNLNATVGGWLVEMIAGLPEPYREAVKLAEVDGLRQREIAERLGLSLSGAKSRVQRGRSLLRGLLLDCCHLERDRRGNVIGYERRHRHPDPCCDRAHGDAPA